MSAERPVPGVTPETALLRSLCYQAPPELSSVSSRAPIGEIVNLGRKRVPEAQKKATKAAVDKRYWQSEKGKETLKRYYTSEQGREKNAANKRLQRQMKRLNGQ